MISRTYILLFILLSAFIAPGWCVSIGDDTLTEKNNAFSDVDHSIYELEEFLVERIGEFVDSPVALEGSSLGEKLNSLARKNLYELVQDPITDEQTFLDKNNLLFLSFEKELIEGNYDNFIAAVEKNVIKYITSVVLREEKDDFSVKTVQDKLIAHFEKVIQNKDVIKKRTDSYGQILRTMFAQIVDLLQKDFKEVNGFLKLADNLTANVSGYLSGITMNAMADEPFTVDPSKLSERYMELFKVYHGLTNKNTKDIYACVQWLLTLYDTSFRKDFNSPNAQSKRQFLISLLKEIFLYLISVQDKESAEFIFKNTIPLEYLNEDLKDANVSENTFEYLKLKYTREGIELHDVKESDKLTNMKAMMLAELCLAMKAQEIFLFSTKEFSEVINNLDILMNLPREKLTLIDTHSEFLMHNEFDVSSNYEIFDNLYNAQLRLKSEQDISRKDKDLHLKLDKYLDSLLENPVSAEEPYNIDIEKWYVFLKLANAYDKEFPSDYKISFHNVDLRYFTNFMKEYEQTNMEYFRDYVKCLIVSTVGDQDVDIENSESVLIFQTVDIAGDHVKPCFQSNIGKSPKKHNI